MAGFRRALALGVDAVELDVRLTRDKRPAIYHYYYLEATTTDSGPIFLRSARDLDALRVVGSVLHPDGDHRIPMLEEVVEEFAGRIGLEIELKGPEPEAAAVVGNLLTRFRHNWDMIEVTSFEPGLLIELRARCPDITTALLFPRSEEWMHLDVVAYAALQKARLARAQAVHLHANQLSEEVVSMIRAGGVDVHAHSVNDDRSLKLAAALRLSWVCTDDPERALAFRRSSRLSAAL